MTFESSNRIDATKRWWKFVPCTWASRRKGPVSERRFWLFFPEGFPLKVSTRSRRLIANFCHYSSQKRGLLGPYHPPIPAFSVTFLSISSYITMPFQPQIRSMQHPKKFFISVIILCERQNPTMDAYPEIFICLCCFILEDGYPPDPSWRRSSRRPRTTWIDHISSDTGMYLTDEYSLARDRSQWRAVVTASKATHT